MTLRTVEKMGAGSRTLTSVCTTARAVAIARPGIQIGTGACQASAGRLRYEAGDCRQAALGMLLLAPATQQGLRKLGVVLREEARVQAWKLECVPRPQPQTILRRSCLLRLRRLTLPRVRRAAEG